MWYTPPFSFEIDLQLIRTYDAWRRQALALFIHELVHMYQFFVVCHCSRARWNSLRAAEVLPDKIQDLALAILGCGFLLAGSYEKDDTLILSKYLVNA